jgi:aspartate dehydrogenase
MVRIGLVGCGTIGSRVARAIERNYSHVACLVAVYDHDRTRALQLQRRLSHPPRFCSLSELIRRSQLVIEAASPDAARAVVPKALRSGREVLVMSVGGLLNDRAWRRLVKRRGNVYIPSGALAGLDGVKALAVGRIRSVSLTTRKPPNALAGAPYLTRRKIDLSRCRRPITVFDGTARAVVKAFPQNTNVAAALTFASGVSDARPRVRVIADPSVRINSHEIDVIGDAGRIRCRIESRPSSNPKTSELAVRSALATLDQMLSPVRIGT